jgi:hypothetical protein
MPGVPDLVQPFGEVVMLVLFVPLVQAFQYGDGGIGGVGLANVFAWVGIHVSSRDVVVGQLINFAFFGHFFCSGLCAVY